MTQPVQEPSQGRTDQAQEFRTRQLFRRPSAVTPEFRGIFSHPFIPSTGWSGRC